LAKLTIVFGVLLIALGVAGFVLTGSQHPTALIPVGFGLVLCVCGVLANTEDSGRRMLWMHIAVTVGLLGFLATGARVVMKYVATGGAGFLDAAIEAQLSMCVLCGIFVALCVGSFVSARRSRRSAA
jgi:hypothetical protein